VYVHGYTGVLLHVALYEFHSRVFRVIFIT
jgi:hypothetical protein